jgi:hypothetical protein
MVQSPPPSSRSVTTTKPNRTVAALLVDYLELEGATTVFGVPGGALIYVMDELWRRRETFNFVICRHETGAGYIAHGYALVTGGLGVVLQQRAHLGLCAGVQARRGQQRIQLRRRLFQCRFEGGLDLRPAGGVGGHRKGWLGQESRRLG